MQPLVQYKKPATLSAAHRELAFGLTAEVCYTEKSSVTERVNDDRHPLYLPRQLYRSPMAEFVIKNLVKKSGLETQFHIESAATSTEEIGNPAYP